MTATETQLQMLIADCERDIKRGSPLESQMVSASLLRSICMELIARRAGGSAPAHPGDSSGN